MGIMLFQSPDDIHDILKLSQELGMIVYTHWGVKINVDNYDFYNNDIYLFHMFLLDEIPSVERNGGKEWIPSESHCINLGVTYKDAINETMRNGYISVSKTSAQDPLRKKYSIILKRIKMDYILSTDKNYYISQKFYSLWNERKIKVDNSLRFLQSVIECTAIEVKDIEYFLKSNGFIVNRNGEDVRIGKREETESWIVSLIDSKLSCEIVARKRYYTNESECIFVYIEKKRGKHELVCTLDSRTAKECPKIEDEYIRLLACLRKIENFK